MILQCPRCRTKYNLDQDRLDPEGSKVRCTHCGNVFTVFPPPQLGEEPLEAGPSKPLSPPLTGRSEEIMDFLEDSGPGSRSFGLDDEPKSGRHWLRTIVIILAILFLLAGLALAGLILAKNRGLHLDRRFLGVDITQVLPFFKSQAETPAPAKLPPPDPGNARIHLEEGVEGRFLDGLKAGRMFVIQGRVKNAYKHPVSEIKLRGLLHTKDKRAALTTLVLAGNKLPEEELKSLDKAAIEARLNRPKDPKEAEAKLAPGKNLEFMIVFFDLPENLTEYTVEVVSSRKD